MSISALLNLHTMNGGSGFSDDQRAYHYHHQYHPQHISRDLPQLPSIDSAWKSQQISENKGSSLYASDVSVEHVNTLNFDDNLYDSSRPQQPVDPIYGEPPFNQANSLNGMKKSANMTQTVKVPSSEHVAEIVGRQGCKIKSLRTQTNTYIKTPVRGAEPLFVVTGRKEDVTKAIQQITSAAEHFSSIRAKRNGSAGSQGSSGNVSSGRCSPCSNPGNVTIQVPVPYKVVGLVVGPKGATIKRIQQTTSTYIVTPGRDKEPIFEVTGTPEQVEKAKDEIEKHIQSRTSTTANCDLQIDDFQINGIETDASTHTSNTSTAPTYSNMVNHHDSLVSNPMPPTNSYHRHCSAAPPLHHRQPIGSSSSTALNQAPSLPASNMSEYSILPHHYSSTLKSSGSDFDPDEGLGASGSSVYDPSAALWSDMPFEMQRSNSVGGANKHEMLAPGEDGPHPRTRRTNSDPLSAMLQSLSVGTFSDPAVDRQSPMANRHGRIQALSQNQTCTKCRGSGVPLFNCGPNLFCAACTSDLSHH